ncbi:SAM-dependent methyltransferase [Vibrio agarivorans]|uniref:SAM-dependent methyltransferase n=1 Tax=Vibrio agarivorans TaxID=153622 RepID=UPI0025B36F84|nr:cyclopropane-fatty-acyl-phospholipid synthase family protein [Vibrio agarivorans]MDN3662940.1 cyclopropane-fatty-acyl-phospholipid synthase family protein [Vibrio agarivorans]
MMNATTLTFPQQMTRIDRSARQWLMGKLEALPVGHLTIVERYFEQQQVTTIGQRQDAEVTATIIINEGRFFARMLKGGSIAAGEAFMDGWWESPDLTAVMELMARNMSTLDAMETQSGWLTQMAYKVGHWLNRNTLSQSKKNIGAHYDLGNDMYELFLDKNMLYSSALYLNTFDSLEQAQINKMERLCQQLQLQPSDRVLEIGTGWGAMAIYMAQTYGCHVTTTTISEEQFAYAESEVKRLGLESQVTLIKQDYRLLEGEFDKVVSIEMIEAVGKQFLASYIAKCQSLLVKGGRFAIQAITIADQRFESYSQNVDFIQKYIFPGGFLPSVSKLAETATRRSDFVIRDVFDIGLDYAKTLNEWHERFNHQEQAIRSLGYDERFIRMWRYYLCYCEGGFKAKSISTVQMTFERPL